MSRNQLEGFQSKIQAVLQGWLTRQGEIGQSPDGFNVFPAASSQIGDLFCPLAFQCYKAYLADGILVKELLHEHFKQFRRAHQPSGLQVLHGHVLCAIHNHVQMPHHSQSAETLLLSLTLPLRLLDDLCHGALQQPTFILLDGFPVARKRTIRKSPVER